MPEQDYSQILQPQVPQEISPDVLGSPDIQELLARIQKSPEETARERIAQQLGAGQKGVKAKLKGILGILEAAGSGFVHQPSLLDKTRARAYEEYKTVTPQLERQLEATIRYKTSVNKANSEAVKTANAQRLKALELYQKGKLTEAQLKQIEATAALANEKGGTERVKQLLLANQADLLEKYGTSNLGSANAAAMLSGGTILGDSFDPAKFRDGQANSALLSPSVLGKFLGDKGGGGPRTTVSQGSKLVTNVLPGGREEKYFIQAPPTTTVTTPAGSGPLDPNQLAIKKGINSRLLNLLSGEKSPEPSAAPVSAPAKQRIDPVFNQPLKPGSTPGTPPEKVVLKQPLSPEQGVSRMPGGSFVVNTRKSVENSEKLTTHTQMMNDLTDGITEYMLDVEQPGMFGKFFGGYFGEGSRAAQELRKAKNLETQLTNRIGVRSLDTLWNYIKDKSGTAVTPAEWTMVEKVMPNPSDRVEYAWAKAATLYMFAQFQKARQTLTPDEQEKAGVNDVDALTQIAKFVTDQAQAIKAEADFAAETKQSLTSRRRHYMNMLSIENALPKYREYLRSNNLPAKALQSAKPGETNSPTKLRIRIK